MANIKPLPKELQIIAEKELKEIPENINKTLQNFKLWLEKQTYLKARLDDQFLIQFLRKSKYNLEEAEKNIDLFYTFKTLYPELANVTEVNSANFRKLHNHGIIVPLPHPLNDNGPRIYFSKFEGDVAKGLIDINDIYSVLSAMNEIVMMEDPYACINGVIYILDLKEISLEMALKFDDDIVKRIWYFMVNSIPLRVRSAYMINTPKIFQSAVDVTMKIFENISEPKIHFYSENLDDFLKVFPKKYLPIEYGGENGCRKDLIEDYNKKWLEYENYFKDNTKYGTNEELRPGKPFVNNNLHSFNELLKFN